MKMNLKEFLKLCKLTTVEKSSWNEDGYRAIQFQQTLQMTHKKFGDFAWIGQEEIEIEIPDNLLINKPVETTNEQPKVSDFEKDLKVFIKARKHAEGKNPKSEWAYCNGALDAFNFLKSKLG